MPSPGMYHFFLYNTSRYYSFVCTKIKKDVDTIKKMLYRSLMQKTHRILSDDYKNYKKILNKFVIPDKFAVQKC